jgi:hypothetical protein|tara:strand:- start:1919 stop:2290 length:372 start_codon:yes stop_codon:yes gene_type:complete
MDMPRFAELVVFPTPPFPEVTTTVLVAPVVFRLEDDSPFSDDPSALVVTFLVGVVVSLFKKTDDENDRPLFFLDEEEEDKTYDETRCCCAIIFLNVFNYPREIVFERKEECVYIVAYDDFKIR